MLKNREIRSSIYGVWNSLITDDAVIINTTPHSIRFSVPGTENETVELEPSKGALLNAEVVEEPVFDDLVTTTFKPSSDGWGIIATIEHVCLGDPELRGKNLRIVGSIIAAQAYPGRCVGLVPCPGYERVAPSEKRMRLDKFNIYIK